MKYNDKSFLNKLKKGRKLHHQVMGADSEKLNYKDIDYTIQTFEVDCGQKEFRKEEVIADFDKNQLAAEEKYGGKMIQFSAYVDNISEDIMGDPFLALGITTSGIPFGGPRGCLTDVFFLIGSTSEAVHLKVLARLSRLIQQSDWLMELRECGSSADAWQIVSDGDSRID